MNMNRATGWMLALVAMIGLGLNVRAGSLDSPATPSSAASAMFTLEDIYSRLNDGTPGTKRTDAFAEPTAGPGSTGHATDEIMAKAPAKDEADGATPSHVLAGKIFWGLTAGSWGVQTGSMVNRGAGSTVTPGTGDQTLAAGYWSSANVVAGDMDLVAENIKKGVNMFGVVGTYEATCESMIRLSGTLDFGNCDTGQTKIATLTIHNDADCAMTVTDIQYSDARFSGNWSGKIYGGSSVGVAVSFTPELVQDYSGTITVNGNATSGTNTMSCTGTGTQPPGVRYVDNGDGTVTDLATGLMWTKNANLYGSKMTWANAVTYCDNLVANGYSDWRLPSVEHDGGTAELDTLGRENGWPSAAWAGFAGAPFLNVVENQYWSSVTSATDTTKAWRVYMYDRSAGPDTKIYTSYVWPVRGGQ